MKDAKKSCDCKLCIRNTEFTIQLAKIADAESRKFFSQMYNELGDIEEELEIVKIYQRNLRETYPKIYRECKIIGRIEPGTEKHPELNI
jgi:predicted CoA-binding protein